MLALEHWKSPLREKVQRSEGPNGSSSRSAKSVARNRRIASRGCAVHSRVIAKALGAHMREVALPLL